jgi:hypothetical protein
LHYFQFSDEVHRYQNFVKNNIKSLGNYIIITEQLCIKNIKDTKYIDKSLTDMLLLDLNSKRLVIAELKNEVARDSIVGQFIKYYDLLHRITDELKELLFKKQSEIPFDIEEINCNPKILLVVPDFREHILSSISYVKNIDIDVVKFNAIQHVNYFEIIKEVYDSQNVFMEDRQIEITNKISKAWNLDEYLNEGYESKKIELLKQFIRYFYSLTIDKKHEVFFSEKKITFLLDKKVWGTIFLTKKIFDNYLDLSIKLPKDYPIPIIELQYSSEIYSYKLLDRTIKIKFSQIPTNLLKKML